MRILYHNDMSTCAQKARVCLAEKGLEWESRHLDLRAGDQQQPGSHRVRESVKHQESSPATTVSRGPSSG